MNFNARTRAVGTHRRVVLHYLDIKRQYKRKTLEKAFCYAARHMFDELRRPVHLASYNFVHGRIVECMVHIVGLHGPGNIISGAHRHRIVVAGKPFLVYHSVERMKLHGVDEDVSTLVFVHKKKKIGVEKEKRKGAPETLSLIVNSLRHTRI